MAISQHSKPIDMQTQSLDIEMPSTSGFSVTSFAGAQDLVNDIIEGVLDSDECIVTPPAKAKLDEAGESWKAAG